MLVNSTLNCNLFLKVSQTLIPSNPRLKLALANPVSFLTVSSWSHFSESHAHVPWNDPLCATPQSFLKRTSAAPGNCLAFPPHLAVPSLPQHSNRLRPRHAARVQQTSSLSENLVRCGHFHLLESAVWEWLWKKKTAADLPGGLQRWSLALARNRRGCLSCLLAWWRPLEEPPLVELALAGKVSAEADTQYSCDAYHAPSPAAVSPGNDSECQCEKNFWKKKKKKKEQKKKKRIKCNFK